MSFSSQIKTELSRSDINNKCCKLAQFTAIFSQNSKMIYRNNNSSKISNIEIISENAAVSKVTVRLLHQLFDIDDEINISNNPHFKNRHLYSIKIKDGIYRILNDTELLNLNGEIKYHLPKRLLKNKCCRMSYLRGLFLAKGSINNPNSDYHLEITLSNQDFAKGIKELLSKFDINGNIAIRKSNYVFYIKDSQAIISFLAIIGAYSTLLKWEDIRIVKELKNYANRVANCDSSNLSKTISAAFEQTENIKLIDNKLGMGTLSKGLKEIAEARLKYPDISILDLGRKFNPPLSKSAVNHRLIRINKLAKWVKTI